MRLFPPAAALAVLLAAAPSLPAQDDAAYGKKRDRKLDEKWVKRSDWNLGFDAARRKARESKKMIFAYFTRSYVKCTACEEAENETLSKISFSDWSKEYVLFLHVTSWVSTDRNQELFWTSGGVDFPLFAFLDDRGRVLARLEEDRTLEAFREAAELAKENAARLAELEQQMAGGEKGEEKAAQKEHLTLELELFRLTSEEARRRLAELELAGEEEEDGKEFERMITELEVSEVLARVRPRKDSRIAAGRKFAAMWDAGRRPGEGKRLLSFLYYVMVYAEHAPDAVYFERALELFKENFGDDALYEKYIGRQEGVLRGLLGEGEDPQDE